MLRNNVTTISVRELKAKASELLHRLEKEGDLEIVITRHGKPCAKLVPLSKRAVKIPPSERISLLNTWSHLPLEPTDADFEEAKRIWEPRPIE